MTPPSEKLCTRRGLLRSGGIVAAGVAILGTRHLLAGQEQHEDITPGEDLMREHAAIGRMLLIYAEFTRRLVQARQMEPDLLLQTAELMQKFGHDYHEREEENHVFPLLQKANLQTGLIKTLVLQHERGRATTAWILKNAKKAAAQDAHRRQLIQSLEQTKTMYDPHKAFEDTMLFNQLRSLLGKQKYAALGETLEHEEHKALGEDGFNKVLAQIAAVEKKLGIADLARYTPKAPATLPSS